MADAVANPCAGCQRLQAQVDQQRAQLEAQGAQLEQLQAAVARLQEQLAAARKDSSTSSKPPSSDLVKPPLPALPPGQDQRQRGGQVGHPKHERALFPPEQVEHFYEHTLGACPCCGGPLRRNGGLALVVQQVDVAPAQLTVAQHTCPEYWCVRCERAYKAALPEHMIKGGLVGPRLTTLIAYFKGFCHASFSTIRKFLRDVVKVTISRGQLAKVIGKVSASLQGPYQELLARLPAEAVLNVDGWRSRSQHSDISLSASDPDWQACARRHLNQGGDPGLRLPPAGLLCSRRGLSLAVALGWHRTSPDSVLPGRFGPCA